MLIAFYVLSLFIVVVSACYFDYALLFYRKRFFTKTLRQSFANDLTNFAIILCSY